MCCSELPSEWQPAPQLQISPIIKYLLLTGPVINSKTANTSRASFRLPLGQAMDASLAGLLGSCRIISLLLEHGNGCTDSGSSLGIVHKIPPEFAENLEQGKV